MGEDGNDYMFLLKGHEDLRQDERVCVLVYVIFVFICIECTCMLMYA